MIVKSVNKRIDLQLLGLCLAPVLCLELLKDVL
jgi:hypothetical protein